MDINDQLIKSPGGDQTAICVDDIPALAKIAERQRFIIRWYKVLALAPFCVVLFVVLKLFPNAAGHGWDALILISLGWAIVMAGIALRYTFWGFDCPSCEQRFGMGDSCRSCGFARHTSYDSKLLNLFASKD